MRLSQIHEMFDDVALGTNVRTQHSNTAHTYRADIDNDEYVVHLSLSPRSLYLGAELMAAIDNMGGRWSTSLKGPNDFDSTGKGNFADVYGFMLAAIKDAILNYDINVLYFSGAESGMDLVYNRFIKTFRKMNNPAFQFEYIKNDIWASERGLAMLGDDTLQQIRELSKSSNAKRDNKLQLIRIERNNHKRYKHLIRRLVKYGDIVYRVMSVDDERPGIIGRSDTGNAFEYKYFNPEMIEQLEII